jgi:hypothetical protein
VSTVLAAVRWLILEPHSKAAWAPIVAAQEKSDADMERIAQYIPTFYNVLKRHSRKIQDVIIEKPVFDLGSVSEDIFS